jgi:hypothetical protein
MVAPAKRKIILLIWLQQTNPIELYSFGFLDATLQKSSSDHGH